jgi:hypothetical protein
MATTSSPRARNGRAGDAASANKQYLLIAKDEECMTTQVNFKASFVATTDGGILAEKI